MRRIRIIAAPFPRDPQWVRQKWVGLEMPFLGEAEEANGGLHNQGDFEVDAPMALELLKGQDADAAQWVAQNHLVMVGTRFKLPRDACQLIV